VREKKYQCGSCGCDVVRDGPDAENRYMVFQCPKCDIKYALFLKDVLREDQESNENEKK
jgi:DNA-directed RNA polymerase subunit RPC12/RpoP